MSVGILFDLDGTLLNTLEDLTDSVNEALKQNGYPPRTVEEMRLFVGNGAAHMISRAVPGGADPKPVLEAFHRWYPAHCQIKTCPYPGIMEALEKLKGRYPVAVVSNKPDEAVKVICRQLFPGIHGVGERPGIPRKPAPDMVLSAMKQIGVDRCVYIGDSDVDIATANNAGVPCISVLWGFRTEQELIRSGADCFCSHPSELPDLIEKLLSDRDNQNPSTT